MLLGFLEYMTHSLFSSRSLSPSPVRPNRRYKRNRVDNSELDIPRASADHKDVFHVGVQIQPMYASAVL